MDVELVDRIADRIAQNEAVFSGRAAMVALVAILPAALRRPWRRRSRHAAAAERPALPRVEGAHAARDTTWIGQQRFEEGVPAA